MKFESFCRLGMTEDERAEALTKAAVELTTAEAPKWEFIAARLLIPNNDDLPNLPFADKNDIPQWAEEGVSKLYSTGIVSGYEDNTILPNNNMKRAEAATMLYKIENK